MSTDWGPGSDKGEETIAAHEPGDEPTMNLPHPAPPQSPPGPFPPGGSPAPPPGPPQGPPMGQPQGAFPSPAAPWQAPPPAAPPWAGPPAGGPPWQGPPAPGQPPYPYPPGAAGMPPAGYPSSPRRRRWPWWVAGAVAAVAAVLVIALVVVGSSDSKTTSTSAPPSSMRAAGPVGPAPTSSSPTAAPGPPPLDVATLPSLLASAEQVGNVLHHVQMNAREVSTSLASDVSIDPAKCASAVAPALVSTYTDSGYTGVAVQGLIEASPGRHKVIQSVIAFPDEAAAQHFHTQQLSAWQACKLTKVTVSFTDGHPDDHATITIVSDSEGITSTVLLPAGASASAPADSECERAMGVRRNVVVDVRACGQNTITSGMMLVRAINDNIARH